MPNANDKTANQGLNKGNNKKDNSSRIAYISQKSQRLAGALYALTRAFPSDEPLRRRLRDQALALVSCSHTLAEGVEVREGDSGLPALLSQLVSQLTIARDGGLVSEMNFSVFREEIASFRGEIDDFGVFPGPFLNSDYFASTEEALPSGEGRNTPTVSSSSFSGSGEFAPTDKAGSKTASSSSKPSAKDKRRQKILDLFQDRREITVNDVTEVVNGYSTKTIQRDLKALVKNGQLEKHGKRRWSSYTRAR